MSTIALLSWVCVLAFAQLVTTTNLSQALAAVWIAALGLIFVYFFIDLDLFASTLLAVYTSVFLFLTLLGLFFSSYWAAAGAKAGATLAFLPLCIGAAVAFAVAAQGATPGVPFWASAYPLSGDLFFSPAYALHLNFYRLFPAETILLNTYLFVGLVLAVLILVAYRTGFAPLGAASRALSTFMKIRTVKYLRRQVRRKNNTSARLRL